MASPLATLVSTLYFYGSSYKLYLSLEIFEMKNLFIFFCIIVIAACNNNQNSNSVNKVTQNAFSDSIIKKDWVKQINGQPDEEEGFSLKDSGFALSINMATLQYRSWKIVGDQLLLRGTSIGNHTSSTFTDTLQIIFVNDSVLSLQKNKTVFNYHKKSKPVFSGCYFYAMGRDTILLEINITGDNVTGKMEYAMYEKDSPLGFIKGKLNDNLINVIYTFYSEGEKSESEEILKIENNTLNQAHGERKTINDSTSVFVNKNKVKFETAFTKQECSKMHWSYRWQYVKPDK